ncbi:hypothetical protein RND71_001575 [Anisodus tanguticus]|uniref:Ferredoxin thioredoxin reductase alpha chain domain-containing protein n=1 Tax=Anisodus tanguticus TaxID=243964 RepID=A0AAE1T1N6_9SOLA|nr:hypothetical protein RND71_001575 [Anisodus tanguticus]
MTTSSPSFFSSSIFNIPNSKTRSIIIILNPNPFTHINIDKSRNLNPQKPTRHFISKSVTIDNPSTIDEKDAEAIGKVGSRVRVRVRVRVPLKVYHVPKVQELDLNDKIGTLKQHVEIHKGKQISANLPYKVEFVVDDLEGRNGPVKFSAHLKEDEFEFLD